MAGVAVTADNLGHEGGEGGRGKNSSQVYGLYIKLDKSIITQ